MDHYLYLANVYDEMMSDVDYKMWAEYLHTLLQKHAAHKVFEVSCGTGNITFFLGGYGYDITASDNSAAMLSAARQKNAACCAGIRFVHQDMRKIETPGRLDAVISACDGPNYLDPEGFFEFAASAFNALKPGGVLLFDISSRYKLKDTMHDNVYFDETDDNVCIWKNTFEDSSNALMMDVTIFSKKGDLFERHHETHTQYAHSISDIAAAVKKAGFVKTEVFECFTFDKPKEDTERLQFVCLKV